MTEKRTHKVGDVLKDVQTVTRPDGATQVTVTDGLYVLDVAGVYLVNGSEVTVK